MGAALKGQKQLAKAIEYYEKAISLKPDYVEAYHNIGIALKEQNKFDEAISFLKRHWHLSQIMRKPTMTLVLY